MIPPLPNSAAGKNGWIAERGGFKFGIGSFPRNLPWQGGFKLARTISME
jgi:hypothetical protein